VTGIHSGEYEMQWNRTGLRAAALAALLSLPALPLAAQVPSVPPAGARIPAGGLRFTPEDQFHGSVAAGQAGPQALKLSLQDAISRGLKNNLGLLVRGTESSAARAARLSALSALLPNVSGTVGETVAQISLATYGFRFGGIPAFIGPFSYTDARAAAEAPLFDWTAFQNLKAAAENARAAELSLEDGRDLVVESVASGYFAILAASGRVDSIRQQVTTAEVLYNVARDLHQSGLAAAIDELRAQVELKAQQQRLLTQQNELARAKLALARAIGLPLGQDFETTDPVKYTPLEGLKTDDLLSRAFKGRADYRSAEAQLQAAQIARQGAAAERYPTVSVAGNYGDIGPTVGNSHGTFLVTGSVRFNIFDGGRIRSDQMAADSEIERRRNELADLRGKIDFEVRTALLDLSTAAQQVALARDNLNLANRTLDQARDRFTSGVADTVEVVQAQEAVAGANQDLINSLYAHNLAKVALARAVGSTQTALMEFLGGSTGPGQPSPSPQPSHGPAAAGRPSAAGSFAPIKIQGIGAAGQEASSRAAAAGPVMPLRFERGK
jgi:outer membrane protein TolC